MSVVENKRMRTNKSTLKGQAGQLQGNIE